VGSRHDQESGGSKMRTMWRVAGLVAMILYAGLAWGMSYNFGTVKTTQKLVFDIAFYDTVGIYRPAVKPDSFEVEIHSDLDTAGNAGCYFARSGNATPAWIRRNWRSGDSSFTFTDSVADMDGDKGNGIYTGVVRAYVQTRSCPTNFSFTIAANNDVGMAAEVGRSTPDSVRNRLADDTTLARTVFGSFKRSPYDSILPMFNKRSPFDSVRVRLADDTTLARVIIANAKKSPPDSVRNRVPDDTVLARMIFAYSKKSSPDSVRNRLPDDTALARMVIAYGKRSAPDSVRNRFVDDTTNARLRNRSLPDSVRNRLADDTVLARIIIKSQKGSSPDSVRNRFVDDTTNVRLRSRSAPDSVRNRLADDTAWARVVFGSYKRSLPDSLRNRLADDTALARVVIAYQKRSAPDSVRFRMDAADSTVLASIKAMASNLVAFFGACDDCYYRLFPAGGAANKDSMIVIDPSQSGADTLLGKIVWKHGTVPAVYDSAYFYRKPWW